ncbi:hypothetical protein KY499_03950 [Arthrobacter sp. PAMC25284]|uniref:Uncharacterized protein n=1 Tax=Arthrobacter oryzae TaxID=409290 RepID=A0A3N0C0A8_9MICC|nr:hypothetical protein KY499_03950 [Arthrobacter sp. PAMC25284]RNL55633.1 hypothetical protein D7003_09450 [Arthrobacter oryzae]
MFHLHDRRTAVGSALLLFLTMSTAACAAQSTPSATSTPPSDSAVPATSPTPTQEAASASASPTVAPVAVGLCGPGTALNFDRTAFPASPKIDNKWFPLTPGMQYTTTGSVTSAEGTTERTVTHTVTGLTKMVDGVKTQVMWDRDYADGELVESELAFFAQSNNGDVWLFGEYPEEFENGEFMGAPATFLSGLSAAQAGLAMQAEPRTGSPSYVQAHAPAVQFLDCGVPVQENQKTCVPTGCYEGVLVIDEHNPLEPAVGHQQKFYSAGTGLLKVTAVGGDRQETLDLVKAEQLSDAQLKDINQQALVLDEHAYEVNADYAQTPKAEVATEISGAK